MLRGVTKLENAVALSIEAALPYATSPDTGWRDVTPDRKRMVVTAAKAAIAVMKQHGYARVKARRA